MRTMYLQEYIAKDGQQTQPRGAVMLLYKAGMHNRYSVAAVASAKLPETI